jgi:hypothetical protein
MVVPRHLPLREGELPPVGSGAGVPAYREEYTRGHTDLKLLEGTEATGRQTGKERLQEEGGIYARDSGRVETTATER